LYIAEFHEPSLVEVGQVSTLRLSRDKLATKASELRVELVVIGRRLVSGNRTRTNGENLASQ
jgi:hypothetical protein